MEVHFKEERHLNSGQSATGKTKNSFVHSMYCTEQPKKYSGQDYVMHNIAYRVQQLWKPCNMQYSIYIVHWFK